MLCWSREVVGNARWARAVGFVHACSGGVPAHLAGFLVTRVMLWLRARACPLLRATRGWPSVQGDRVADGEDWGVVVTKASAPHPGCQLSANGGGGGGASRGKAARFQPSWRHQGWGTFGTRGNPDCGIQCGREAFSSGLSAARSQCMRAGRLTGSCDCLPRREKVRGDPTAAATGRGATSHRRFVCAVHQGGFTPSKRGSMCCCDKEPTGISITTDVMQTGFICPLGDACLRCTACDIG